MSSRSQVPRSKSARNLEPATWNLELGTTLTPLGIGVGIGIGIDSDSDSDSDPDGNARFCGHFGGLSPVKHFCKIFCLRIDT